MDNFFLMLLIGFLILPLLIIMWAVFIAIVIGIRRASRDSIKWVSIPLTDNSSNWKKLYLIPQLWFQLFWCHATSPYDREFDPMP